MLSAGAKILLMKLPFNSITPYVKTHPILLVSTVIVTLEFFMIVFYNLYTYEVYFHSDSAFKNILSQEILDSGSFFPSSMYFANGLWILAPHLLVIPWLFIFGNSFLVHGLAGVTNAAFIFSILLVFLRSIRMSWISTLLVISVIFSGSSFYLAESLFGQAAYGFNCSLKVLSLFLICWVLKSIEKGNHKQAYVAVGLICTLFALLVASGIRGVLTDVIPLSIILFIFVLTELILDAEFVKRIMKGVFLAFSGILVGTIIGFLLGREIQESTTVVRGVSTTFISTPAELMSNLRLTWDGFVFLVGAKSLFHSIPFSLPWLRGAYSLVFFLSVMFVLPAAGLLMYRKTNNKYFRFLLLAYVIFLSITLFYVTFGKVSVDVFTSRYLIVPLVLAVLVSGVLMDQCARRFKRTYLWLLICLIPLYGMSYSNLVQPYFDKNIPHKNLVKALVGRNIGYGYASYWNAGVVTVLSGFKTLISPVRFDEAMGATPMEWLSSRSWYEASHMETCLILTTSEYATIEKTLIRVLGKPRERFRVDNYIVLVYGFNIAEKIGWEKRILERYGPENLKARLLSGITSVTVASGSQVVIPLSITNLGSKVFISQGSYPINIGCHLRDNRGVMLNHDFARSSMPGVVPARKTKKAQLRFIAPAPGDYVLQIDLLQETVAWFAQFGSKTVDIKMHVQ